MIPDSILGEEVEMLSFLPFDPNKAEHAKPFNTNLHAYELVLSLFIEALGCLNQNELHKFDGQVGDNACQVRAEMFSTLSSQPATRRVTLASIDKLKEARALVKTAFVHISFRGVMPFSSVYKDKNLSASISKMMAAACLSYILCKAKVAKTELKNKDGKTEIHSKEELKAEAIKTNELSKNMCTNIFEMAKSKLSMLSVEYVQQLALRLPESREVEKLRLWVQGKYVHFDSNTKRKTVPCFAFTDIVMRNSMRNMTGVLLKLWFPDPDKPDVKNWSYLFYQVVRTPNQHIYHPAPIPENRDIPVLVKEAICIPLEGTTVTSREIAAESLEDIVLGNEAVHPQYPKEKDPEPADPERFLHYKTIGLKKGLGRDNPHFCFVEHEFADILKHQLEGQECAKKIAETAVKALCS